MSDLAVETLAVALMRIEQHLERIANFLERETVNDEAQAPIHDGRHGPSCTVCMAAGFRE